MRPAAAAGHGDDGRAGHGRHGGLPRHRARQAAAEPVNRTGWVFRLGRWRLPASAAAAALFALLIGLPLGNLVYKAGVIVSQTDAGLVREFSRGEVLGHDRRGAGRTLARVWLVAADLPAVGRRGSAWRRFRWRGWPGGAVGDRCRRW